MKRLLLIRHAKSSHKFHELSDHDRPLNSRGQRDIKIVADWLVENDHTEQGLQLVLSSTAKRSLLLAEEIHKAFIHKQRQTRPDKLETTVNFKKNVNLEINRDLYTFSSSVFFNVIKSLSNEINNIALVGHNPAITEVANQLGFEIDNVPTSGIVMFNCDLSDWSQIAQHNTFFDGLISPKMLL